MATLDTTSPNPPTDSTDPTGGVYGPGTTYQPTTYTPTAAQPTAFPTLPSDNSGTYTPQAQNPYLPTLPSIPGQGTATSQATGGAPGGTAGTSTSPFDWTQFMNAMQPNPVWASMTSQYMNWYENTQYPGQFGLQGSLQGAQIGLAQNQQDMSNAQNWANLTGQVGGDPTLMAQQLMNQYGLAAQQNSLYGQNLAGQYGNTLTGLEGQVGNQDVQMAQIQAQLAQSPLTAWYTARGLPPPASAVLNDQGPNLQQTLATLGMPGMTQFQQSMPQYNPQWSFSGSAPPVSTMSPSASWGSSFPGGSQQYGGGQGAKPSASPQAMYSAVEAASKQPGWGPTGLVAVLGQYGVPPQVAQAMNTMYQQSGGKGNPDINTWTGWLDQALQQYNQNQSFGSSSGGTPGSPTLQNYGAGGVPGTAQPGAGTPGSATLSSYATGVPGQALNNGPAMLAPQNTGQQMLNNGPAMAMPQNMFGQPGGAPPQPPSGPSMMNPYGPPSTTGMTNVPPGGPSNISGPTGQSLNNSPAYMGNSYGPPSMSPQNTLQSNVATVPGGPYPVDPTTGQPITPQGPQPTTTPQPPLSTGAPPWATALNSGYALPGIVGGIPGMPSSQQWAGMSPAEQQATQQMLQMTTGMSPSDLSAQLAQQAPQWGAAGPATYGAV